MRQLLPEPGDVDPVEEYLAVPRPTSGTRPWVTVGMISSLDGATAVDGVSGALGGPADKAVFRAVRAIADVIVVAAGTARAEGYGPVRFSDAVRAARRAAGRATAPIPLAVVTASLDLDLSSDLFEPGDPADTTRPLVFTTDDADPAALERVRAVADVHQCGVGRVDLAAMLDVLGTLGAEVVVCEGGPTLNGAMVDADLVDEWCVSLAPVVAGGDSHRIVNRAQPTTGIHQLASLLTEDDLLFGRWVRTSDGKATDTR